MKYSSMECLGKVYQTTKINLVKDLVKLRITFRRDTKERKGQNCGSITNC